ncbi:MAG: PEP-CTERM sorting domain-containing protein, partial [Armatimonadetes bacterium]|nr:PEP-CTERM sorting domain-containing protein [Armatimonadota bacterium]
TFVPIEQGGGPGTRGGHWAEVTPNVGGTTDTQGRPLTRELMTGFLNANPYISNMTVESFEDIGYMPRVIVIPEAGTMALLALGAGLLGAVTVRRRKK